MSRVAHILQSLRSARRITLAMLEPLTGEQWLHQPVVGGQHALWIAGHLATCDDWGRQMLGEPRQLESWDARFGSGAVVSQEAASMPNAEAVVDALATAHADLLARVATLTDAQLDGAIAGELAEFTPTIADALFSHAWHEGFHCGQLALIRRSLGLPPVFG